MEFRGTAMTSVTGNQKGFTLIEILVVIAIAAILATLTIFNIDNLIRAFSSKSSRFVLEETLQEARIQALSRKESVFLYLDSEAAKWVVSSKTGEIIFISEEAYETEEEAPQLYRFSPQVFEETDTRIPIPAERSQLAFSASGVAPPFAISYDSQSSDLVHYDPLTGYPFKDPE